MAFLSHNSDLIPDDENSTVATAVTPPESVATDIPDASDWFGGAKPTSTPSSSSTVPWPGSTFIICSISSGKVLTLLDGQVVLAPRRNRGSFYWACVDNKGWLGFRNLASGKFLGFDKYGEMCCYADRQQGWENFCVRMRPEGGYALLATHGTYGEMLRHVGISEKGEERLAKVEDGILFGLAWEFAKV